jgi:cytidine deaminase
MALSEEEAGRLTEAAVEAAARAYAPYSRFRVGAALLLADGTVITGANVENASFGLTSCAERNAIFRAVAELGPGGFEIVAVAVANLNSAASSPCGACLQVMSEFLSPATPVYFPVDKGRRCARFEELMPFRFKLEAE